MKYFIVSIISLFIYKTTLAQGCCGGGAANPIAGGASTGVLQKNQFEIAANYQYNYSDEYYKGDQDTVNLIDGLGSNYLYLRADYGITNKLTMSVASGFFMDKTLIELGYRDTVKSKGIGDLILLPRYSVCNNLSENSSTEITLGLGAKVPLSSADKTHVIGKNSNGDDVSAIMPTTVQTTTGAIDYMFYGFFYQGYQKRKLRFFANTLYVKKGYNNLDYKFGDYLSLGLFVGKTIFKNVGITAQLKGEWIGKMAVKKSVKEEDLVIYGIDVPSTGSKKVFFIPQLSYTYKNITVFATSEIPLYQNLNGIQIGSMYQFTTGLTYRFFRKKPINIPEKSIDIVPVLED